MKPKLVSLGQASLNDPEAVVLTYSSMHTFLTCPRRYYWRYERGIEPKEQSFHLLVGTLAHRGLAILRRTSSTMKALQAIPKEDRAGMLAAFLVKEYAGYWGCKTKGSRFVPELTFAIELGDKLVFAGKLDAIEHKLKESWIWEDKTASRIDDDYLAKLPLDRQVTSYLFAAAVSEACTKTGNLSRKVAGVIYNILLKPTKYMRAGEDYDEYLLRCKADYLANPEAYYVRQRCYRSQTDFEDLLDDIRHVAMMVRLCRREDYWPMNCTQCFAPQRTCDYPPLCMHEDSATLLRYHKIEAMQELSQTETPRKGKAKGGTKRAKHSK